MVKKIGFGTSLAVTSTTGQLTIGQIRTLTPPGTDATDVDTTTLDSSSNFRTFVSGPIDPGEVTFELAYDPSTLAHQRLSQYHNALNVKTFTIDYASTFGTQAFSAYIKSLGAEVPLDDLITQSVTLKVSGLPAYATTT